MLYCLSIAHSFFYCRVIFYYLYILQFVYLFMCSSDDGYLGCFHFWLLQIKLLWIFVFVWTYTFFSRGYIPRNEIAALYHIIFNFIGNCQMTFQSGCPILHSHWQHMRVSVIPDPSYLIVVGSFFYLFLFFLNQYFFLFFWLSSIPFFQSLSLSLLFLKHFILFY